ncbi:MAG: hypothetical protein SYR96_20280 [Actinomycetota bacterium]|nr:hypothetical protein [Actinomycetota bacterium]
MAGPPPWPASRTRVSGSSPSTEAPPRRWWTRRSTIVIFHEPASTLPPGSTNTFPQSNTGTSDPDDSIFEPSSANPATLSDRHLNSQLGYGSVLVKTSSTADNSGTGGQITVNADAVISWSADSSLTLDADKGIDMLGTISTTGNGAVHLKARNGDVDVATGGTIMARQVKLEALAGNVLFDTLSVNPVDYGADGAKLEIFASGDVIGDRIQANGGNGASFGTGAGGKGGTVHIKFGGILDVNEVQADGGTGASGDSMPGGNAGHGGNGGTVTLQHTSGDLVLDGVSVRVDGGNGGSTSSSTGAAGNGGNGGKLVLKTPGKVVMQDLSVSSFGGGTGASAGGPTGTSGSMGSMDSMARPVDVGNLRLDAIWNNAGKVRMGAEASMWGYGTFVNSGELSIGSYSYVSVEGGVKNRGLLTATGTSAEVSLVENTGTVDVLLGAELYTDGFMSNEGTLNVNGTLGVGTISCGECGFAPLSLPTFTNQAGGVIAGSGTLLVADGSGTLENYGKIAPGGVGSTGKLTIDGSLRMNAGSVLHADLVNRLTHDILEVTGNATTGGTVEVGHPAGTSIATGDTFAVLQAGSLDASTPPAVSSPSLVASASGNNLVLRATAPVPAPSSGPTTQQQAQQQVVNQVVVFQQLFEQALDQEEEDGIGRDDIVVTDTACTPR